MRFSRGGAGTAGVAGRAIKLAVALLMFLSVLAAPGATSSVAAEELRVIEPFELSMVEGGGILQLRDAEPYELEQPTSISGSHDTGDGGSGAVTNGVFTTPPVDFETASGAIPVEIEATFSQVTPASGTGVIDAEGNVTFVTALSVELDISAAGGAITGVCTASPVNIQLDSDAPWDPETGEVTVRDPDFTIPAVVGADCPAIVATGVNDQLAGGGHSLSLRLAGDLNLPPEAGCPTTTALAVAPAEGSTLGQAVTFTATVAFDPEFADDPLCEDAGPDVAPTGIVELRDGTRIIGTAELDGSGVAVLTTSSLPAGTLSLSARYRGGAPYSASTSEAVTYRVSAPPAIVADLPEVIEMGADPVEFDVTVTNTGFGDPAVNARLDLSIQRIPSGNWTNNAVVQYFDGQDWVDAPRGTGHVVAALGPLTGFELPVGAEETIRVRLAITGGNAAAGAVTFDLVEVDPETGLPTPAFAGTNPPRLARTALEMLVVEAERRASVVNGNLQPHTARPGYSLGITSFGVAGSPGITGRTPSGTVQFFLDGEPVGVQPIPVVGDGYVTGPIPVGPNQVVIQLPPDVLPGTRQLTARYSGDAWYRPSELRRTITVLAPQGPAYECPATILGAQQPFSVNISAHANVPAARPAGSQVQLGQLDIRVFFPRKGAISNLAFFPPVAPIGDPPTVTEPTRSIDFGLGALGSGTADAVTFTNVTAMSGTSPPEAPDPDAIVGFQGARGSIAVEGEPGDVIPVTLDSIDLDLEIPGGFPFTLTCTPIGEPISLGEITVAGTELVVDAPSPTREGQAVTLRASVAPAGSPGTVEFRDGSTTIGVVPVAADGTAVLPTTFERGTRSLTARFFGGLGAISTTSRVVEVEVLVATECAEFAEAGNGAVVRLVYLELLGRCPDAAGYASWVQRLDGGMSPEVFANTIARTNEALGRVVDDGYSTMLDRAPDAGGRAFWIGRLGSTGRYDQLLADLASSNEFWVAAGSTNDGFVTLVYERILGRAPDPGGLAHWTGQLNAGVPRGTLVSTLARLDEPLGRIVNGSYAQILSRAPFAGERTSAIAALRATGNRSALYAALIGTSEFFDRAQSFPNPED